MMGNVLFAFFITFAAGLSTGIGSVIAFFFKATNKKFLSVSLGFSAGVMIYVSMTEIFFKAKNAIAISLGDKTGMLVTIFAFFGGMLLIGIIDMLIPNEVNLSDLSMIRSSKEQFKLMRSGLFTALAIAIHNFPEGLATFVSALQAPSVAVPIVVAIAFHNIPEGIAVSVPIYYAEGNKKKAFFYSFASGLSEPVGAIIGYVILLPLMSALVYGLLFAVVAGRVKNKFFTLTFVISPLQAREITALNYDVYID